VPTLPSGSLAIRLDESAPTAQRVSWGWKKGEATSVADFGDPRGSTDYAFCVYRRRNPSGVVDLALAADVEGGAYCLQSSGVYAPCWKVVGTRGFDLKNPFPQSQFSDTDGLGKIVLRAGSAGKATVKVKAAGPNLRTQIYAGLDPVVAQLRASNGVCWEAGYVGAVKDSVVFVGTDGRWDYRAAPSSPSGAFLDDPR